jgi:hypothetical protein
LSVERSEGAAGAAVSDALETRATAVACIVFDAVAAFNLHGRLVAVGALSGHNLALADGRFGW